MDSATANILQKHSESLSSRPGMSVGNDISIDNIEKHLEGYLQALYDTGKLEIRNVFSYWLSLKYKKWSPKYTWGQILLNEYGTDAEAIKSLAEVMRQFLLEISERGETGVAAEYDNHKNS